MNLNYDPVRKRLWHQTTVCTHWDEYGTHNNIEHEQTIPWDSSHLENFQRFKFRNCTNIYDKSVIYV